MHVALDALPLQVRSAGIAVYTDGLARALVAERPGLELTLFGMRGLRPQTQGEPLPARLRWRRSALYPFIMGAPLMHLPRLLPLERGLRGIDVFHATNYATPRSRNTPIVLTVHDLALLRYPELGTAALRRLVGGVAAGVAVARRIVADSEATARDLRELLAVPASRLRVVYPGCDPAFFRIDAEACHAVLARHGLRAPYLLHVGTLEPRKNLVHLLRAYQRARTLSTDLPPLLLAGADGWGAAAVRAAIEGLALGEHVRLIGHIPAGDLPALYSAAALFVYPSRYEGFGLPALEAMACGAAVITSDVASLPELVGDAALRVDPDDMPALADAIVRVLTDSALRNALQQAGPLRAAAFTWDRCARAMLAVYDEAVT